MLHVLLDIHFFLSKQFFMKSENIRRVDQAITVFVFRFVFVFFNLFWSQRNGKIVFIQRERLAGKYSAVFSYRRARQKHDFKCVATGYR